MPELPGCSWTRRGSARIARASPVRVRVAAKHQLLRNGHGGVHTQHRRPDQTLETESENLWRGDGAQIVRARPRQARRRVGGSPAPVGRLAAVGVGLAAIAIVAALVIPAAWRSASTEVEASGEAGSLLTLVNQSRANAGLAPLSYASDLSAVAAERASIMANSGALSHTPDAGARVCCWTWIAENVAYAGSVQSLHDVLMNSSAHRANILNADADDIGIAVVRGGGSSGRRRCSVPALTVAALTTPAQGRAMVTEATQAPRRPGRTVARRQAPHPQSRC